MKKNNDRTFGTKLTNALNLATVLAGFTNYKPPRATESLAAYNKLISDIQEANHASAVSKELMSLTTEEKHQLFSKHGSSLRKLLAPINSAIKAQYGFGSKESADVRAKLRSMRGERASKLEVALPTAAAAAGEKPGQQAATPKTVSVSHRAIGSVTQSFADMIAAISQLSPAFDPANPDLALESLQQKHAQLLTVSNKMAANYADWKKARASRDEGYLELKDRTKRIKSSVMSQYGAHSTAYSLIKNLSV